MSAAPEKPEQPARKPTRDAEGSIFKKVVKRKTSNGKTRKETIYVVRVRMNEYDEFGKLVRSHEKKRLKDNYNDALLLRRQLRQEIKDDIARAKREKDGNRIYFFDLLDFYEKHYVKEAVFSGKKKIAGQRTPLHITRRMIKTFREFFGNIPVKDISYSLVFDYKLSLQAEQYKIVRKIKLPKEYHKEPAKFKIVEEWRERKPATVHRYLACLRRILYVGIQQGFATVNPFKLGDPLIQTSAEETRNRICTFEEEEKLYSHCVPPRQHLKNVIVCAVDTFLRENELFSLLGSDVDFDHRFVTVRETNAKTLKERTVPLTDRAFEAFLELRGTRTAEEWNDTPVFPFASVKRSWYKALELAGIDNLHFHDLRGTGITRMLDAGVPVPVVMKFSGHDQYETFMKYVKKDLGIIQNAGAAMSEHYNNRKAELAKGRVPLSPVPEKSSGDIAEVTELGEAIN